eukprot:3103081-Amphidinium_carterae.1
MVDTPIQQGPSVCLTVDTDDEYELLDDSVFGDLLTSALVKDEPSIEAVVSVDAGVAAITATDDIDVVDQDDRNIEEGNDVDEDMEEWLLHARRLDRLMSGQDSDSE